MSSGSLLSNPNPARASAGQTLALFTRFPRAGQTKTRLIPALGPDGAARAHQEMTEHVLNRLRRVVLERHLCFEIHFTSGSVSEMRQWLGREAILKPQAEGNLGARLARAASEAFAKGMKSVVMVGADCPGLDGHHIRTAFDQLAKHPVVFGPATDGGYYLIGLSRDLPQLFEGIPWGTERVLADSMAIARRLDTEPFLLPELADVDEPADLAHWEKAQRASRTLSVIIPALNEARVLPATLKSVAQDHPNEILVVDGGSVDDTSKVAGSFGAQVISSPPGRARQMNHGAAAARGEILLFVHADTELPAGYRDPIHTALRSPHTVSGAFSFRIREPFSGRSMVEWLANMRSRLWQLPFGDQGLFVRRWAFEYLGGFPDISLMEDYELVRRLKRLGKVVTLTPEARTSGRRWRELGVIRTTLINRLAIIGYRLGIAPSRLANFYYRQKG
jgi:rSAM/selenodomain-associated transferase 2/rSAM/selenodomain-associated transferase 1